MSITAAERARRAAELWQPSPALLAFARAHTFRGDAMVRGDAPQPVGAGTRELAAAIRERFPFVWSTGMASGYRLDQGAAWSTHHEGRAIDAMVRELGGRPDPRGDELAAWLVQNASDLGVQYLIWRGTQWSARTGNVSPYEGAADHWDHVHVDLTRAAARTLPAVRSSTGSGGEDGGGASWLELLAAAGLVWGAYKLATRPARRRR